MKAVVILAMACAVVVVAQTNSPLVDQVKSLSAAEVLRREKSLSSVESLPASASMSNIVVSAFINLTHGGRLTPDAFRELIDRAKPLKTDDPSIFAYHYAPWCKVSFETKEGQYVGDLCLGRGFLQYPDGKVVAFDIVQEKAEKPVNNTSDGIRQPADGLPKPSR